MGDPILVRPSQPRVDAGIEPYHGARGLVFGVIFGVIVDLFLLGGFLLFPWGGR